MGDFLGLLGSLDPDPRVRGKQFEHICKWFLTNDPTYKTMLRRVWLWKEWPDRWSDAEAGIDLVAEDYEGRLWAIQVKAYAATRAVTKDDVNKFLADSARTQFAYRLLIATTDKVHHVAHGTINAQEKEVGFVGLSDLLTAELDWPPSLDDLRPSPPPEPATPRDYQREAIDAVIAGFNTANRGQLIMACGSGKTVTSLFITEKLAAERTLVLVPSLSLLKQTMRVWQTRRQIPFDALPVCSDETVGRGVDSPVTDVSELGVPVTTDPQEIAAFLRRQGPRVAFSTYQSSPQIAAACALDGVPGFDLVVADEAHRVAGPVSSDFATVLDEAAIKVRRRLFMTATPRYFTGRVIKAAQDADFEVASMDDETKFGTVFHRLTFSEAIERGLLTDYRVAIVGVDSATYKRWADNGTVVTRDGKEVTDARTLAGQIGLAKAMSKYDLHRTISFHSRVSRAREFAAEMPEVIAWMPADQRPNGALWARHASGEMSAGQRHILLQRLSQLDDGERGLLTNARCLSEGVDVPALDGVAFIDPRRSEIDIVQAVGRAIRNSKDKIVGTVVIPVFIDTDTDTETALDDSVFKPVWDVIKALRAHDEELGEQIDSLRRQIGREGGTPRLPDKIHFDVPVQVGEAFVNAFDTRLVEQTSASWEFWFGLLEEYVEEHGDALVKQAAVYRSARLGSWVNGQRLSWSKGRLEPDRCNRLQQLRGWSWDLRDDAWEEGFAHLILYVQEHLDAQVPDNYMASDGYALGTWTGTQRAKRRSGTLSQGRKDRLDAVPGWTWDPRAGQWQEGFNYLRDFVNRRGNARVKQREIFEGFPLGQWVSIQRMRYSKGTLDAERQVRLESLHPTWSWDPFTGMWEEGFSCLQRYIQQHGDARVPDAEELDGYKLGSWVQHQRQLYRKGKLSPQRQALIEGSHDTWSWDPRDSAWEDGFDHLLNYVEQNGHAVVLRSEVIDGYPLGRWVSKQRDRFATAELGGERVARLARVHPTWTWDPREALWEEGFNYLRRYIDDFGDARVSAATLFNGYRLGQWVSVQRGNYQKRKLSAERQKRLESTHSTWTWDPFAEKWETGFAYLERFVRENGHARVPKAEVLDGYKLGVWTAGQRRKYMRNALSEEYTHRLQQLPGWVWQLR